MAPETFSDAGKAYSVSADVYSFGIVMWEIAARLFPFQEYEKEKWGVFDFRRRIASCKCLFFFFYHFKRSKRDSL